MRFLGLLFVIMLAFVLVSAVKSGGIGGLHI